VRGAHRAHPGCGRSSVDSVKTKGVLIGRGIADPDARESEPSARPKRARSAGGRNGVLELGANARLSRAGIERQAGENRTRQSPAQAVEAGGGCAARCVPWEASHASRAVGKSGPRRTGRRGLRPGPNGSELSGAIRHVIFLVAGASINRLEASTCLRADSIPRREREALSVKADATGRTCGLARYGRR
jgi:hypothetical protein